MTKRLVTKTIFCEILFFVTIVIFSDEINHCYLVNFCPWMGTFCNKNICHNISNFVNKVVGAKLSLPLKCFHDEKNFRRSMSYLLMNTLFLKMTIKFFFFTKSLATKIFVCWLKGTFKKKLSLKTNMCIHILQKPHRYVISGEANTIFCGGLLNLFLFFL